jgi:hypothetical protein
LTEQQRTCAGAQRPLLTTWHWQAATTRSVLAGWSRVNHDLTNPRQELRLLSEGFD